MNGTTLFSNPDRGDVAVSCVGSSLNVFMTEESIEANCPPFELIEYMASTCGITDPKHFSLLSTVFSDMSVERIGATFDHQGIYVKVPKQNKGT